MLGAFVTTAAMVAQAIGTLLLVIVLAWYLPSPEFVVFSVALATAQFAASIAFEWLRLGTMRHFPGSEGEEGWRLSGIRTAAYASAAFLVVISLFGSAFETSLISVGSVLQMTIIAILQGTTDLLFTVIRFSGRLILSGVLQILRSFGMVGAAIVMALLADTGNSALWGIIIGYVLALFACLISFPLVFQARREKGKLGILSALVRQGVPAAAASQVHLSVSYGLRLAGVAILGTQNTAASGFLLALDIIQRPFPLLGTVVTVLFVPGLNRAFDEQDHRKVKEILTSIYDLLLGLAVLGGVFLAVLLPVFAEHAVDAEMRSGFLAYGYIMIFYFGFLLALQTGAAVVPQLLKKSHLCLWNALVHFVLSLAVLSIGYLAGVSWSMLLFGAVFAVGLSFVFAAPKALMVRAFPSAKVVVLSALFSSFLLVMPLSGLSDSLSLGMGLLVFVAGSLAIALPILRKVSPPAGAV